MKPMLPLSIHPLPDFARILTPPCRLAALDIGTRTIGIALSTPDWQTATPLKTIIRGKWSTDLAALDKALHGYDVCGLIVGLPYNMDGSEGPRAQGVRQVVYNIAAKCPASLSHAVATFVDERMSSAAASHALEGMPHAKSYTPAIGLRKASGALDALAAQVILERALSFLRSQR